MTRARLLVLPTTKAAPDLQALVERAGRRYAASVGEEYDPEHCPHHGGYQHVTPEEWAEWDRAVAEWLQSRRDRAVSEREANKRWWRSGVW